jgi:hypothetical protein
MIRFTKARHLPRNILETPLYFSVFSARSQKRRKNGMFVIYRKLEWHLICGRSGTDSKALYIYTYISVSAFLAPVAENREFTQRKKRTLWFGDCFRKNIEAKKLNNTTLQWWRYSVASLSRTCAILCNHPAAILYCIKQCNSTLWRVQIEKA